MGGIRVNETRVGVEGGGVSVSTGEVGVPTDKTSTEKMQALSSMAVNTKLVISRNRLLLLTTFSHSAIDLFLRRTL